MIVEEGGPHCPLRWVILRHWTLLRRQGGRALVNFGGERRAEDYNFVKGNPRCGRRPVDFWGPRKKTWKNTLTRFSQVSIVPPHLLTAGANEPIAPEVADVLCPPGTRCFRVFFLVVSSRRRVAMYEKLTPRG